MIGDAASRGTISPRFTSANVALSNPPTVSPERASEVSAKAERVTAKAEAHFEKHRQSWTNRRYGELLSRDGGRVALRPAGMPDDRKAHLARAADALILQRQARRLAKIERAANNMLGHGERDRKQDVGR